MHMLLGLTMSGFVPVMFLCACSSRAVLRCVQRVPAAQRQGCPAMIIQQQ